jgi:flavin-dependent dehydrogenase
MKQTDYDVVILGGGFAGSTLAIQIKKQAPETSLLIIEKATYPVAEAAHKVGESSVEIGSHYLENILGLSHLLEKELPKLGLRFFYSDDNNLDIAARMELGPRDFPVAKSYQIDRGRFENALVAECKSLGIDFLQGARVQDVSLGQCDHQVSYVVQGQRQTVNCKWTVDASGRYSVLKRKLKLSKAATHNVNAAWFRIDHQIDIDDWSSEAHWNQRVKASRRFSTNHLMGKGYWVWLIPLSSGATSIGIVADAKLHPFKSINSFENARKWLSLHEPQCADVVAQYRHKLQDFRALKHYSHNCKKMFSADGWCLTGDAGVFIDPFYSPGNDFIAINNSFICEMLLKQLRGGNISTDVVAFENQFRIIFLAFLPTYQDQYPIMGHAKVMSIKVLWDFVMYWGSIGLLFFTNKLTDLEFMATAKIVLLDFYRLNIEMQELFRTWAEKDDFKLHLANRFLDYTEIDYIFQANKNLLPQLKEGQVLVKLQDNLESLRSLANEIYQEAGGEKIGTKLEPCQATTSSYFEEVFAMLR